MKSFRVLSAVEQLADHLRDEILGGSLQGDMPGMAAMVRKFGVGTKTVVAAMEILKREGLVLTQGERKRTRIASVDSARRSSLNFSILFYEMADLHDEHIVELKYRLEQRGHRVTFASKALLDMRFDLNRVIKLVEKTGGDAWIIRAGPRPVLEWFASRQIPSFAMYGRQNGIPMAGLSTNKSPAVAEALQRLVSLKHRRIVMLAGEDRRKPTPGQMEMRYLEELQRLGIHVGNYNLPDWEDNRKGFHRCLDSLFRHTPPTAIFPGSPSLFFATQQYLLGKGLVVPRDVSLIAPDDISAFEWFEPEASVIRTETRKWVPRMLQWANHVANGRKDLHKMVVESEFIEGGTIGPARA